MYTDAAPTAVDSSQTGSLETQFMWTVSDESSRCHATFLLTIERVSPPFVTILVPNVTSGSRVKVYPGVYRFIVTTLSGAESISSFSSDFTVLNGR